MSSDLHTLVRQHNFRKMKDHVKHLITQILQAVNYIHKSKVLHRDLKPGNILVNEDCSVKIADFGLGKLITSEINNNGDLTNFVCTRWFRPPELMMGYCRETYDEKIDCFSVGCILAEILRGKVLFQSASEKDQIKLFTQILGNVPEDLLRRIRSQKM